MTFDDDFVLLQTAYGGKRRCTCAALGLTWPPPLIIRVKDTGGGMDVVFVRERFSQLTDEQRRATNRVCRGAVYNVDLGAS
jgi:hypothetical protein